MPKFDKVLWIRAKNAPDTMKPVLVGIDCNEMYWHGGPTHCTWTPEKYQVVRDYAGYDIAKAEEELRIEYAPKPQIPSARLGFIAPNGDFYPCGYCCHNDLESILSQLFYPDDYNPKLTERYGWVSLKGGAYITFNNIITEAQNNTLNQVISEFEAKEQEDPDINWCYPLKANPEGYNEISGWSDPSKLAGSNGRTYAQALRYWYDIVIADNVSKEPLSVYGKDVISKRLENHPGD